MKNRELRTEQTCWLNKKEKRHDRTIIKMILIKYERKIIASSMQRFRKSDTYAPVNTMIGNIIKEMMKRIEIEK